MIRIRRGTVLEVASARPGAVEILVEVEGSKQRALAYTELVGPVAAGDRVVLNTGAVALGLGTGGLHFVIAVEGGPDTEPDTGPGTGGHAMKLRYTPVQHAVPSVEESHREEIDSFESLDGAPVVIAGLHSALAPVAIAVRAARPDLRLAYVMTEGGALPIAFSETVAALKAADLIAATVTIGQAFGGDLEAVNKFSGLIAARRVARADVIVVAPGPGNLGTASRYGFAPIEAGEFVNAVTALGGRPIVAPRLSFADHRERHRGVSHHTLTALRVAALAPAEIALPPLEAERDSLVRRQLAEASVAERHEVSEQWLGDGLERLLASPPVPLETMGRNFAEDPDYFRAAAAAGVLAARSV